jgi:hypothetical protein
MKPLGYPPAHQLRLPRWPGLEAEVLLPCHQPHQAYWSDTRKAHINEVP